MTLTYPVSSGVILRVSGERSTKGITISDDWTKLSYEFDVHGIEDVELAREFRGGSGACGYFDDTSPRPQRAGAASPPNGCEAGTGPALSSGRPKWL